MNWIHGAAKELFGLFVDDVPFTLTIVVWLGAGYTFLPRVGLDAIWDAPLLFLGCATILVESVRRAASKYRRQQELRSQMN